MHPLHVPLREPPPAVRPALAVVAALLLVVPAALGVAALLWRGEAVPPALLVLLVMFVVPVAGGLRRLFRKRRAGALVVAAAPAGSAGPAREAPVLRVDLPGAPPLETPLEGLRVLRAAKVGLVLGTEERALVIPHASLAPGLAGDVGAALLERVRALPASAVLPDGGGPLAALLARRDEAAGAIERRPLVVTWSVTALIALVFALEVAAGALTDGRVLLALGAARRDLVLAGDGVLALAGLWRVPAAALLHGHLLHLGLNAMSLMVLGPVLERWLSKWRYVLVLLGAALAGTGASALLRDDVATVGLSGGLFGMLGALATTTLRYRKAPLVGPRLPLRSWIVLIVANGILTAAPGVDAWAHLGGALAGALIAVPLTPSIRAGADGVFERVPSRVKEPAARIAAVVVLTIFAVGLAGIVRAFVALR